MNLKALILSGYGLNAEEESKYAIEKSGGKADIVHINRIIENPLMLENYNLFMVPGGFAFGDDLGSGKVLANKLICHLRDPLEEFVDADKLMLGIGNGFQVFVKMGLLPKPDFIQRVTLYKNISGHFEDRWVILRANPKSPCVFTKDISYLLCPIRSGEGKFLPRDEEVLNEIKQNGQIVFQYTNKNGKLSTYPHNPNGSIENIAAICNKSGRIFGMMPRPESFTLIEHCPYWIRRTVKEPLGLGIFKNAVDHFKEF